MKHVVLAVFTACHTSLAIAQTELPSLVGPYLQNPGPSNMTFCLLADDCDAVKVELKKSDSPKGEVFSATRLDIPGSTWSVWKVRSNSLTPDTSYTYQVQAVEDGTNTTLGPYHFKTQPSDPDSVKLAFFNDIHERHETLEALMPHADQENCSYNILLGDCWNNPGTVERALRTMANYIRILNAMEKPFILVRGNHEYRGKFASYLAYFFDLPLLDPERPMEQQYYNWQRKMGPAWFLTLDTGEDFEKRYDKVQPMRRYQDEWMKELIQTKPYGEAPWRILLTHIPLYNSNIWNSEPSRQLWEPTLVQLNIDLALAGHDHGTKILPKGTTYTATHNKKYTKNTGSWEMTPPYPVCIGGGPKVESATVMLLDVTAGKLDLKIMRTDGTLANELVLTK